ncbi:MAG: TPM domain-containing protein [Proteobacteria bacterium]|nr:TPM domain-containing protein [Pseudomonadota bacterium]
MVATFPSLENEDLVDFTHRLFKKWNPGQQGKNNGVLLAVFMQEHKIRIEVGYGLEPVLTDALSKRIIEGAIKPRFREGEYAQGLIDGSKAIVETLKTGDPGEPPSRRNRTKNLWFQLGFIGLIVFLMRLLSSNRDRSYSSGGTRPSTFHGFSAGDWGAGSGSGGGDSDGDSGGFSGGGGESGGGGASGDW